MDFSIIEQQDFTTSFKRCKGCENFCQIKVIKFSSGNTYYSGNQCEKYFSNKKTATRKGINQHAEKFDLLFSRAQELTAEQIKKSIGIPRALGIYENFPFWHTLFTEAGFLVTLSAPSSNALYESGIHSIMSDNICFPAKLMHGHIQDLVQKGVERIFYPYIVHELREDEKSAKSYNCPIVSGYSDVLKSALDSRETQHIQFDTPVISFHHKNLMEAGCLQYLKSLGVNTATAKKAIAAAYKEQINYLETLKRRAMEIAETAETVIVLAGRPYHVDPLIQHKICNIIAEMGVDVITENITYQTEDDVYNESLHISQWAYPNRLLKAANWVAKKEQNVQFVQLTSFGCGPDAFIIEEIKEVLHRKGKNLTLLKIDDVNNIGSLRLRIRSMLEINTLTKSEKRDLPFETTKIFNIEDKRRTILAPYFANGYSEFIPVLFEHIGYRLENLPMPTAKDAEVGLQYANNEVCYPATLVIGNIINNLKSGRYNLDEIAIGITQTGGQCRASNYIALIKKALIASGYQDIPVISVATEVAAESQPGFQIAWKHNAKIFIYTLLFADALSRLYYASVAREKIEGGAKKLRNKYTNLAIPLIKEKKYSKLLDLLSDAAKEFQHSVHHKELPRVGVVGEIYLKYNEFSHLNVLDWLAKQQIECIAPSMYNFFANSFVNQHINKKHHIENLSVPTWVSDIIYKLVVRYVHRFNHACSAFPYYIPFSDIFHEAQLSEQIIHPAANFGEGWLIPAEIAAFAEQGINNVISLQPFGCIANHVIAKGIEKKVKKIYPKMNLLFLDFDGGVSPANIHNRLHFLVENCTKSHGTIH